MKISEAFAEYIKREIIAMGGSAKTAEHYQSTEKILVKFFGDIKISKISVDMIDDFCFQLQKTHKRNTIRGYISCFRSVIRYFRRKNYSIINPDEIKSPKPEKTIVSFLNEDEVTEFIEIVGRPCKGYPEINRVRNVVFVTMLFKCGLRISELCGLNRDSIKNREFQVVGKSKSPRPCYVPETLEEMIKEYLSMRMDDNPALFYSQQSGNRMTPATARLVFRRACRQSDFNCVHPHTMRHSCATYLMNNGIGLREVGAFLGHENMNTTKIYTHVRNEQLREICDRVMG